MTRERAEIRDELKLQLEEFSRKERHLEEKKLRLSEERKKLWNTRDTLICQKCRLSLADRKHEEIPAEVNSGHALREERTAGDGQNHLLVNSIKNKTEVINDPLG